MNEKTEPCKHERILTWRIEDTNEPAGLWSCSACSRKFAPVEVAASPSSKSTKEAEPVATVGVNGDTFTISRYLPPGTKLYLASSSIKEDGGGGAPGATDAERAAWLADKIGALGDYAKEAAAMLRRWPAGAPACLCGQPISDECKANGCRWEKEKNRG